MNPGAVGENAGRDAAGGGSLRYMSSISCYQWPVVARQFYEKALECYQAGERNAEAMFTEEETAQIASIGAKPIEFFDYAEDARALPWETALLILAVRRDYFMVIQKGDWEAADKPCPFRDGPIPARDAELEGMRWLPRVIYKAEARLRGRLPREVMFSCGGDRAFFDRHNLHAADFLRFVWAAKGNHARIAAYVRKEIVG